LFGLDNRDTVEPAQSGVVRRRNVADEAGWHIAGHKRAGMRIDEMTPLTMLTDSFPDGGQQPLSMSLRLVAIFCLRECEELQRFREGMQKWN